VGVYLDLLAKLATDVVMPKMVRRELTADAEGGMRKTSQLQGSSKRSRSC
jgi:hypothetical protein